MAKGTHSCIFFGFLSLLIVCSHGSLNPPTVFPTPPGSFTPIVGTTPTTNPGTINPTLVVNTTGCTGQSWCVSKTGASQSVLQIALEYACGLGGADCSPIQPGASCFEPDTLQSHASYAFNSYYQKQAAPTSCDFGGTAMLTNVNPSTGSCTYPSSSSTSSSTSPSVPTTQTLTTLTPPGTQPIHTTPPTTISPPAVSGSGCPPKVFNPSTPTSGGMFNPNNPTSGGVFNQYNPTIFGGIYSGSADLQPFIFLIVLITSTITGKLILKM